MKLGERRGRAVGIGLAIAVLAVGGCGGGKSTTPTALAISNLLVSFGVACTVGAQSGTVEVLSFNFVDPEGDVQGGTVENNKVPNVGPSVTLSGGVPSPGITISGTTSGTVTITECIHFGSATSIAEHVTLVDAAGHRSNDISTTVTKPSGAAEVITGGLKATLGR
jgi:hypothetical protein